MVVIEYDALIEHKEQIAELRKKGYHVKIERIASGASSGCGYSIVLNGELNEAESLLRNAGIKILEISEK